MFDLHDMLQLTNNGQCALYTLCSYPISQKLRFFFFQQMSEENAPARKTCDPLSATVVDLDNVSIVLMLDAHNKVPGEVRFDSKKKCSPFLYFGLVFRTHLPPFLDCVKERNIELVKEHLSRGAPQQVGFLFTNFRPRFSPLDRTYVIS